MLDLTLRADGRGTLDDVMRALWSAHGGGPIAEADFAAVLRAGRRPLRSPRELARLGARHRELPLPALLAARRRRLASTSRRSWRSAWACA